MTHGMACTGERKRHARLWALSAAVILLAVAAEPALAQFDFLFGFPAKPAPPEARPEQAPPPGPDGSHKKHGRGKEHKAKLQTKPQAKQPAEAAAHPGEAEEPAPAYEPQLLRLAEILGSLAYLDELCTVSAKDDWRAKMQGLIDTEAKSPARKERLAGSYNRGFRDFERSYRFCTPNAQAAIDRFLKEGSKIARDVANRYGAS